jgi:hypothetical protein
MLHEIVSSNQFFSDEFNSQDVDLWAFATMGTKPGKRTMGLLEKWVEAI